MFRLRRAGSWGTIIAIIGGGPAGWAAGLYAACATCRTICFERHLTGGQIALAARVENYPGFTDGTGGYELAQQMEVQAVRYGMDLRADDVLSLRRDGGEFAIVASKGELIAGADGGRDVGARAGVAGLNGKGELPSSAGLDGGAGGAGEGVAGLGLIDGCCLTHQRSSQRQCTRWRHSRKSRSVQLGWDEDAGRLGLATTDQVIRSTTLRGSSKRCH